MDFNINEIAQIETGMNQDGSPISNTANVTNAAKAGSLSSAISQTSSLVEAIKQADLKKKAADAVLGSLSAMNDQLNQTINAMIAPLSGAIEQFKKIPPELRKAVDIEGAKNNMYDKLNDMLKQTKSMVSSYYVSVEVPIQLSDYNADPYLYPNLLNIDGLFNNVTEEDCLSSGYTKIIQQINYEKFQKLAELFKFPEDCDIVADTAEQVFNTTVKTTWNVVKPPLQVVAGLAQIDFIQDLVTGMTNAVDGMVQVISTKVKKEDLNKKIAQQDAGQNMLQEEANKAANAANTIGKSAMEVAEQAGQQALDAANSMKDMMDGALEGAQDAFDNFKTPPLADDLKDTLIDFYDAIMTVKNNIQNIYMVLIFKMMGKVFDCFNEIIGVLGVPTIPDPLGQIPKVITDMVTIMDFVNGLPMSMVETVKAIIKKKQKALQIAKSPTPPQPVQTQMPLPPTSKDTVKPDASWDDVKKILKEEYQFQSKDADAIVQDIQTFYNGTDEPEYVITGKIYDTVEVPVNDKVKSMDVVGPDSKQMKRPLVEPLLCITSWLKANIEMATSFYPETAQNYTIYYLLIPHKDEYKPKEFWDVDWETGNKKYFTKEELGENFGMHNYQSTEIPS